MVVGGSVIGLVFNGGVMIATDNLCSYGKMARYKNIDRIAKITD